MGFNNNVKFPCKGCTKRSKPDEPNCHMYCKEYLECKKRSDEITNKSFQNRELESMVSFYKRRVIVNE